MDKKTMGVLVRIEDLDAHWNYGKSAWIRAYPVVLNPLDTDGFRYSGSDTKYEHVVMDALLESDRDGQTVGGHEVKVRNVYSADLHEVKQIAATLAEIERKWARLVEEQGYSMTFGQSVCRFAASIGAKIVIREWDKETLREHTHLERFHQFKTGDAVMAVDRMITEWKERYTTKKPEVQANVNA